MRERPWPIPHGRGRDTSAVPVCRRLVAGIIEPEGAVNTRKLCAVEDLGLPDTVVAEIEGRLRSQQQLLGKIVGVMFPALFGCRTPSELCRIRGWDKNWPSRLLGALPKRSWLKRLRRLGLEVLEPIWRHVQDKSPATQSRWQWTWVWDDSVFHKYGEQLQLVGRWWSGQQKRVLSGIDGLLLLVVVGEGRLIVPVDFAIRRPDPLGPGAPCRDKLTWARVMLDERLAAFGRRGLELPAPMGVADSWFGDSKLMQHVRDVPSGHLVGRGQSVLLLYLGRWATGQRPRPDRGQGVALASAPLGGGCALRAAARHQSDLWPGDRGHRR